jgi:hypothetical protein
MGKMAIETGHLTPRLLERELLKVKRMPERILITHLKPKHAQAIKTELQKLRIKNVKFLRDEETSEI